MTMATANDLAKYLLSKSGQVTTYKLQKLIYYCQAWSLGRGGSAIFVEDILAFEQGPLVHSVFHEHVGRKWVRESTYQSANVETIAPIHKLVDEVLAFYGQWTAEQLVQMTHAEAPWIDAYQTAHRSVISRESMQNFYDGKTFESAMVDCQVQTARTVHAKHAGLMRRLAQ
jgi:uncharacterized phage-associated protein